VCLTTNTCLDTTSREAIEQGFDVTYVSDAVATFTMDMQRDTIELNWPRDSQHIRSTAELISALGVDPSVAAANV
jgi:nicotinamidase-related amidase